MATVDRDAETALHQQRMARRRRAQTMDVVNPATEEVIATVPSAEQRDVDAAVAAARAALDGPWGKMSARERGRLVRKLGDAAARARRRGRAARDAAQRQADLRVAADRDPGRRRVLRVLRRLGRQGAWGRRFPSRATTSPTRCASRSASSRRSCRGTSRCCWRPGRWRRRWPAATPSSSSRPARRRSRRSRSARLRSRSGLPPGVLNVITGPGSTRRAGARRASRHRQDRLHRRHQHRQVRSCAARPRR